MWTTQNESKAGAGRPRAARRRRHGHWSIRTYLAVVMVAAFVAVSAASAYGFLWSTDHARDDASERMAYRAHRAAVSIASAVEDSRETVESLAAQPGITAVFAGAEGCTLSAHSVGAFESVRLDIVRADGQVACSSTPSPSVHESGVHAGSRWLAAALSASETEVSWDAVDAVTQSPSVVVAVPLLERGEAVGVVALLLHAPNVANVLAEELVPADHATFTVVDVTTGALVATSGRLVQSSAGPLERFGADHGEWVGLDGVQRLFASSAVPASTWRVHAGAETSAILEDSRAGLYRQGLVAGISLLVLAVAIWVLNRHVAGPLRAITDAVSRAGRESAGVRADVAGTSELVLLGQQVNAMLDVRAGHEAQLEHQATHDPLTGLPNRLLLRDRLDVALGRRAQDKTVAVLFCGVNQFDVVHDSFGHDAGDRVLLDVAGRLSAALRPGDTIARFGDADFVVVCEDVDGEEGAVVVAQRLQHCLEAPFTGLNADIVLRAAVGISVAQGSGAAATEQLLREADTAMRQARAAGREWALFAETLHARATHRLEIESELRQALQREDLVVYYQPLHDAMTGRTVGAEALVRWVHPERGLVPPLDFIPLAEETGQISQIGRFVLDEACQQATAWSLMGYPLRISVNVSVAQLRQDDFAQQVQEVLTTTGLPADQLCLEITESSLMRETAQGTHALNRLKALGVHLAIDDFGTGYSSLSYLHQLPVDELKIDRSFIKRLNGDARDQYLVEAIISMARALGLTVVAEGVELPEQLRTLRRLRCETVQGYLFGAPRPAAEFLSRLQTAASKVRLPA